MSNKVISLIAVIALFVGVAGIFTPVGKTVVEKLGANAGPEVTNHQYFMAGVTTGGGCFATSTTGTLTAAMLNDRSCITITATGAGQGALSLTMPASTSMPMIPRVGDCQTWFLDNSGVAAGTTTTIVAGTGHDVIGLDATGAGTGADVIDGVEFGKITSCRQADSDVVTFVQEYIHAD